MKTKYTQVMLDVLATIGNDDVSFLKNNVLPLESLPNWAKAVFKVLPRDNKLINNHGDWVQGATGTDANRTYRLAPEFELPNKKSECEGCKGGKPSDVSTELMGLLLPVVEFMNSGNKYGMSKIIITKDEVEVLVAVEGMLALPK